MKARHFQIMPLVSILVFIVSVSLIFSFTSPERIVEYIGLEKGYLLLFIVSFAAGLSTFTSVPYQIVLVALASGGLNPVLLGFTAASGITIGDTTSYLLGYYGRVLLPEKGTWIQEKIERVARTHPKLLPIVFFGYGALVPLSNDLLTIPFGIARYPFFRLMVPLGVGTIIYCSLIAALGEQLLTVFSSWFT